jgi:hypothetical protein
LGVSLYVQGTFQASKAPRLIAISGLIEVIVKWEVSIDYKPVLVDILPSSLETLVLVKCDFDILE